MKIRTGFVSNSSSSSFMCDVCKEIFSGWDACLSKFDMYQCENGHIFCYDHLVGEPTINDYRKFLINIFSDNIVNFEKTIETKDFKWHTEDKCKEIIAEYKEKINKANDSDGYVYETIDDYEFREYLPSHFCPICSKQKKLKHLVKTQIGTNIWSSRKSSRGIKKSGDSPLFLLTLDKKYVILKG